MCTSEGNKQHRVIHPAVPVKLKVPGSNNTVMTYMGLDAWCSDVYIKPELLNQLGDPATKEQTISLTTMNSKNSSIKTKVLYNVEVSDIDENEKTILPVVYSTTGTWPFERNDAPQRVYIEDYPHIRDLPFNFIDSEIGILVGMKHSDILRPIKVIPGVHDDDPYATLHKFGWALNRGIISQKSESKCFRIQMQCLNRQFQDVCAREFIDPDPCKLAPSVEDIRWENKVKDTFHKNDNGKFEVGLPFKEDFPNFPNNRERVYSRLLSSKKKLQNNLDYYKEYCGFMKILFDNDFAEAVPESVMKPEDGKVFYLYHFGVYHKKKRKIRIVFDASLKYKGISLNNSLMQGPDLTNNLFGVLLRFREGRLAFTADIQKMFYAVRVKPEHRDFLRFLWFPDGDLSQEPKEYRVTVHIFGAISSPAIANYALRQTALTSSAIKYSDEVKKTVERNFYVDDVLKSMDDEKEAIDLAQQLTKMLSESGFRLTSFTSTSKRLLESLDHSDLADKLKIIDFGKQKLPTDSALGVAWHVSDDNFGFDLKLPVKECTKRNVLSTVFSVYDPLGFVSPVILPAKRLFQMACHEKLEWDDVLELKLQQRWSEWVDDLKYLSQLKVPRCLEPEFKVKSYELYFFSDGSELAYATVCYLRSESFDRAVHCAFLVSKSHLVPLKGGVVTTVPRIELNGARLAVMIYGKVDVELTLRIDKTYFWTDSEAVLGYINNESKRFHRFVSNRVSYIRENTKIENWRYVSSRQNPADLATRGLSASAIEDRIIWRCGPSFLWKFSSEWPEQRNLTSVSECDKEIIKKQMSLNTITNSQDPIDKLFESSSSWYRIKLRVAWILILQEDYKMYRKLNTKTITTNALIKAEKSIWKFVQQKRFISTITRLKANQNLSVGDKLRKLNPFIDEEDLLRVGGRIQNSMAPYDTKHPLIIPNDHHISVLLIKDIHQQVGHFGREVMLAKLRRRFWMIGATTLVRRVVYECVLCRKQRGKPCEQLTANLPKERIDANPIIFASVGIDAFGPFYVKRARSQVKRYGLIFTCFIIGK